MIVMIDGEGFEATAAMRARGGVEILFKFSSMKSVMDHGEAKMNKIITIT